MADLPYSMVSRPEPRFIDHTLGVRQSQTKLCVVFPLFPESLFSFFLTFIQLEERRLPVLCRDPYISASIHNRSGRQSSRPDSRGSGGGGSGSRSITHAAAESSKQRGLRIVAIKKCILVLTTTGDTATTTARIRGNAIRIKVKIEKCLSLGFPQNWA